MKNKKNDNQTGSISEAQGIWAQPSHHIHDRQERASLSAELKAKNRKVAAKLSMDFDWRKGTVYGVNAMLWGLFDVREVQFGYRVKRLNI